MNYNGIAVIPCCSVSSDLQTEANYPKRDHSYCLMWIEVDPPLPHLPWAAILHASSLDPHKDFYQQFSRYPTFSGLTSILHDVCMPESKFIRIQDWQRRCVQPLLMRCDRFDIILQLNRGSVFQRFSVCSVLQCSQIVVANISIMRRHCICIIEHSC